ncbi:ADP-ribosylation factor [Pholiota conissans]|uniref:ADP-ribosylation factor n=1 Tax=Pholiota conissans TaxID=109636 RepID=A0A9P5YZG1_9AGAR|nr:ADP-ribosylation factor [Pholiota conissans]
MSSILRILKERFYPSQEYKVTFLGLPFSGKTTLLYYLKSGEIFQTIPTIGFNVETVEAPTSSGKSLKMQAWDIGTGCGITYLYGLIRVYLASSDALVWVVDSTDEPYLPESIESLQRILSLLDSDYTTNQEVLPAKKIPILILANKSDRRDKIPLDKIRIAFSKVISGRLAAVYSSSCTKQEPFSASGLPEAFDWLLFAMDIIKSSPSGNVQLQLQSLVSPPVRDPNSDSSILEKFESWVARVEADIEAEEFVERFNSFTLPSWDHYTHIRIAYVLLTKYGRQEGKDLIFKGLEAYISASPQTKGRSFHVTMTYFWVQIVHFGIRNMPSLPNSIDSATGPQSVSPSDFADFLLVNPHVADGNLWSDYYSKGEMMSPKAKTEMVLPDKKPLPNLVARDAIVKFKPLK